MNFFFFWYLPRQLLLFLLRRFVKEVNAATRKGNSVVLRPLLIGLYKQFLSPHISSALLSFFSKKNQERRAKITENLLFPHLLSFFLSYLFEDILLFHSVQHNSFKRTKKKKKSTLHTHIYSFFPTQKNKRQQNGIPCRR